jgi:Mechanosensitive ion channel, conserved TM helix
VPSSGDTKGGLAFRPASNPGEGTLMDINDSVQRAFDKLFEFLPNLLGALLLLLVGFIMAKVVQGVVKKLLQTLGVDEKLRSSEANRYVEGVLPGSSVSSGIARVVFWLVFIFFIFTAIAALGVDALTDFMNDVLAYLPNVIVAIIIFVVAALLAGAVGMATRRTMGDSPTGRIVGTVAPALVMVIALFMILDQLRIAESIVVIAFACTMGALALGLALAFGLGGRGVAERMLEDAYRSGLEARDQMRRDSQTGYAREDASTGASGSTGAHVSTPTTGPGTTTRTAAQDR